MRVVVVGATGTIGRPLVRALSAEHEVVGVARKPPATIDDEVEWIAADATEPPRCAAHSMGPRSCTTWSTRSGAATSRRSIGPPRTLSWLAPPREARGRSFTSVDSAKGRPSFAAPAQQGRDRSDPEGGISPGDHAAGSDDRRCRERGVRDDPRPRRAAAGDDLPALGLGRDPADRGCRRARVLVGVCGNEAAHGQSFDLGGPEVMTYRTMMERVAHLRGKRPILIEVPFLTPRLSSLWLHLVTPASVAVARPLVEGLRVATIAQDDRIWDLVSVRRTSFDDAIRALDERG